MADPAEPVIRGTGRVARRAIRRRQPARGSGRCVSCPSTVLRILVLHRLGAAAAGGMAAVSGAGRGFLPVPARSRSALPADDLLCRTVTGIPLFVMKLQSSQPPPSGRPADGDGWTLTSTHPSTGPGPAPSRPSRTSRRRASPRHKPCLYRSPRRRETFEGDKKFVITNGAVKSHVKRILRRLGAENRAEPISQYLRPMIGQNHLWTGCLRPRDRRH